jgi:hypothetical protein
MLAEYVDEVKIAEAFGDNRFAAVLAGKTKFVASVVSMLVNEYPEFAYMLAKQIVVANVTAKSAKKLTRQKAKEDRRAAKAAKKKGDI